MPDKSTLSRQVADLFEGMNLEVPTADLDLFESGVIDSLSFVQLLVQLEESFGVIVGLEELEIENFRTINHIVAFVEARSRRRVAS